MILLAAWTAIIDKLKKGVLKTKKEAVDEFNSQCYVIRMEARSSELNKEDMDKIKDRISVNFKLYIALIKSFIYYSLIVNESLELILRPF